jgi:UDP-N-acetylglucosamine 4,6-dehydratase
LHEVLISEDESRNTVELEDLYIIQPIHPWWQPPFYEGARPMADVKFSSDENDWWLTEEELHQMIDQS